MKPEVNGYDAGAVEAGSYTALRFDIGIDSLTNHADPLSILPMTRWGTVSTYALELGCRLYFHTH